MNIDTSVTKAISDMIIKEVIKDLDAEAIKKEALKGAQAAIKEYFKDEAFKENLIDGLYEEGITYELSRAIAPQIKKAFKAMTFEIK